MLISEAMALCRRHMDAVGDTERWADADITNALRYALNKVQEDYVAAGGRRLDEITSVVSTSGGAYVFSSGDPMSVKGVSLLQGTRRWPLTAVEYEYQRAPSATGHDLEIRFVPTLTLSSNTGHPLVGNGATVKNTWQAFEELIVVTAALHALSIDNEQHPLLEQLEMKLTKTVMTQEKIPQGYAPPSKKRGYSEYFSYVWIPATKTIQIVRRDF